MKAGIFQDFKRIKAAFNFSRPWQKKVFLFLALVLSVHLFNELGFSDIKPKCYTVGLKK